MTREDKKLLLKDICARIPYGVIVELRGFYEDGEKYVRDEEFDARTLSYLYDDEVSIKPYLRPMSSITEKEKGEMSEKAILAFLPALEDKEGYCTNTMAYCAFSIDYCLEHHLDFRGLIEKRLALEASEDMYKTQ